MAPQEFLVAPKPAPSLNIPPSSSTVDVRIIDSTGYGSCITGILVAPHIAGHEKAAWPCLSFLISHGDRHVLFDLGIRKDFRTGLTPYILENLFGEPPLFDVNVDKDVAEILDEDSGGLGIKSKDIEAVIWSHLHWDHIGDMSTLPGADLVVGPGFKTAYLPGYPTNPKSMIMQSDFENRAVREIDSFPLSLGRFPAHDFFGDGSFYLLSSPGHTVAHLCGLARVTPDTFVLMGGDACHHGGEIRPTEYLPLPTTVTLPERQKALSGRQAGICPGAALQAIHPKHSATEPFYIPGPHMSHDHDEAMRSIAKLEEFDACDNVFVCTAHDMSLIGHVDFYPAKINTWRAKDYDAKTRWTFVEDFGLVGDAPSKAAHSSRI